TIVWCMGQTQHTIGNAIVRASCILQLALGNIGKSGGGANIFRGHDNVQGATDVGPNPDSLPGYYGLAPGSWAHWAKVWNVDLKWLQDQFASPAMMTRPGITVSRWIDGVLGTSGAVTASHRSIQWREKVIERLFESRCDQSIMYTFAERLGCGDQLLGKKDGKQIVGVVTAAGGYDDLVPEDILKNEIN